MPCLLTINTGYYIIFLTADVKVVCKLLNTVCSRSSFSFSFFLGTFVNTFTFLSIL